MLRRLLLLMYWFIADRYCFYFGDIVRSGATGFDDLLMTVVSDKLSGDDDLRPKNEQNLRFLIDPDRMEPFICLTRSPRSDTCPGDLLADNLSGWLNAAIRDPAGEWADQVRAMASTGVWQGWHVLQPGSDQIRGRPATEHLADYLAVRDRKADRQLPPGNPGEGQ